MLFLCLYPQADEISNHHKGHGIYTLWAVLCIGLTLAFPYALLSCVPVLTLYQLLDFHKFFQLRNLIGNVVMDILYEFICLVKCAFFFIIENSFSDR